MESLPKTLKEAKRIFIDILSKENLMEEFKSSSQETLLFRGFWRLPMVAFGLDHGNPALVQSCGVKEPDDAAKIIVQEVWEELNGIRRFSPKTLSEAVKLLLDMLPADQKKRLEKLDEESLSSLHMGLGTYIRNYLSLWRGNQALIASCGADDADGASMVIIKAVWRKLRQHDDFVYD